MVCRNLELLYLFFRITHRFTHSTDNSDLPWHPGLNLNYNFILNAGSSYFLFTVAVKSPNGETRIMIRFIWHSTHVIEIHKANDGGLFLKCAAIIIKNIGRLLLQCFSQVIARFKYSIYFTWAWLNLETGQVTCAHQGDHCASSSAHAAKNYQ
jgi:hypothetical protein